MTNNKTQSDNTHSLVSGELPNLFYEPALRGRLCNLRIRAHESGAGELVAQHVELNHAKEIVRCVNSHEALRDSLRALIPHVFTNDPTDAEMIKHWERERELGNGQAQIVLNAYAALSLASGGK